VALAAGPTGVFSHQTALSLHDLTDLNPAKLDLTVPQNFRRGIPIPEVLRLHRDDCELTTRRSNLVFLGRMQCGRFRMSGKRDRDPKPVLCEAFREAMKRGDITKTEVAMSQKDAERAPPIAEIRKRTK
jgi:hypothetical protein